MFKFGPPRDATFRFRVPACLSSAAEVFRVDADGITPVDVVVADGTLTIRDQASRVAIYVAATTPGERARIEARRQSLIAQEDAFGFDPGLNADDLAVLKGLTMSQGR